MREALAPIFAMDPPAEMVAEMPYAEIQCAIDDPPGYRNYWSAEHLTGFPDEAVDVFCARAHDMVVPSPSQHIAFPWGGAVLRGVADWPLPHRDAQLGRSTRSGSGRTRRTTSRRSRGAAASAPASANGRRVACT